MITINVRKKLHKILTVFMVALLIASGITPLGALTASAAVQNGSNIAYTRGVDSDGDGVFLGGSAEELTTDIYMQAATPGATPVLVSAPVSGVNPNSGSKADISPSFSPDGTKIAWASNGSVNGSFDIFVKDLASGTVTNLTNTSSSQERWPEWSADGQSIVYNRRSGSTNLDIWIMNANGTNQHYVAGAAGSAEDCCSSFTTDGQSVIFASNRAGNFNVYKYALNPISSTESSANLTQLTNQSQYEGTPSVEATGTVLYRNGNNQKIYRLNPNGPINNGVLVSTSGLTRTPTGSPDGQKIIFGSYASPGAQMEIAIADANGSNQVTLTNTSKYSETDPSWQPKIVSETPDSAPVAAFTLQNEAELPGAVRYDASTSYDPDGTPVTRSINWGDTTVDADVSETGFHTYAQSGIYTVTLSVSSNNITSTDSETITVTIDPQTDPDPDPDPDPEPTIHNGRLVYVRSDGSDNEIYAANADGSNEVRITDNTADDTSPTVSPDGSTLVYSTNRDGNYELYSKLLSASATDPGTRLTANTVADRYPVYSPDGTKIVYTRANPSQLDIFMMNADGSNQLLFAATGSGAEDSMPAWSQDGSLVAFRSKASGNFDVWVKSVSGGTAANLTASNAAYDGNPSFATDGTIYYQTQTSSSSIATLVKMNSNGSGKTSVYATLNSRAPRVSPDGTALLFTRINASTKKFELVRSDLSGQNVIVLVSKSVDISEPTWQPAWY